MPKQKKKTPVELFNTICLKRLRNESHLLGPLSIFRKHESPSSTNTSNIRECIIEFLNTDGEDIEIPSMIAKYVPVHSKDILHDVSLFDTNGIRTLIVGWVVHDAIRIFLVVKGKGIWYMPMRFPNPGNIFRIFIDKQTETRVKIEDRVMDGLPGEEK